MISALSRALRRICLVAGQRWLSAAAFVAACGLAPLPAAAAEFSLAPDQTVVGDIGHYETRQGDVLAEIARRFDVGYTELVAANPGVDPWVPGVGRTLTIPSRYILPAVQRQGIVVDLGQYRLFYFPPGGGQVITYPIGIGVIGWDTPLGTTRVVRKEPNPAWYPPASIHAQHPDLPAVVPPGPDNPLGAFALHLGWPKFLIHGTNKPDGVGRNVSHGCIHLYPEDIAQLFGDVSVGTPVRAVDEPAAAGWVGDRLYLSVHPSQSQVQQIDLEKQVAAEPAQGVRELVGAIAGQYGNAVDWRAVDAAARQRTGMPIVVADRSGYGAQAGTSDDDAPAPYAPQRADDGEAQPYAAYRAPPSSAYGPPSFDPDVDQASARPPGYSDEGPIPLFDRTRPPFGPDTNQPDDSAADQ